MLKQGSIFDNRYQLIRLLGRGGFSEVWLAKDSYTRLDIAIKVYAPGSGMDTDGLVEFSQELAGVFNLNHTNLLKPTHVDAWEGMPYLILPFCSQGSIVKRVGKMSEEEIWKLIHDVASGLAYLHQHDIVHQDIKPDNILVDDNGNYLITDFGISTKARSTLRKSVAAGTVNAGTMAYMGPERFSKQPTPTKASDIWSFGAMVYELITGIPPFEERGGILQKNGAEIPDINEPVSDALKQVVEQMMSLDKDARPTASQLVEIANTHLDAPAPTEGRKTQRIQPAPVPPVEQKPAGPAKQAKPEQPNRKKRIIIWTSVLVLLVIAGVAIGVYNIKGNNPSEPSEWHSLIKPEVNDTLPSLVEVEKPNVNDEVEREAEEEKPVETKVNTPNNTKINKIWKTQSTFDNGVKDICVHVNMTVVRMKGKRCYVAAYFYDMKGNPLKAINGLYSSNGQAATGHNFFPNSAAWTDTDNIICIPENALPATPNKAYKLKVMLWDYDNQKAGAIATSDFYEFRIN